MREAPFGLNEHKLFYMFNDNDRYKNPKKTILESPKISPKNPIEETGAKLSLEPRESWPRAFLGPLGIDQHTRIIFHHHFSCLCGKRSESPTTEVFGSPFKRSKMSNGRN